MDRRPTVYIVDDEAAVRDLVRRTVVSMELDVECFASGQQFLAHYDASRIGCLVTDLKMPDMTGQQLLEILAERQCAIPAIMISGHGDIPAAVRAMGAGAVWYHEKPCCLDALRETIWKAIQLAKKRHQEAVQDLANRDRLGRLTPDERITLQMIASGKPDKAIASGLDVSIRTVQYRRASLMKKLQVRTRVALIRLAPPDTHQLPISVWRPNKTIERTRLNRVTQ